MKSMNKFTYIVLVVIALVTVSCKSTKAVAAAGEVNPNLSAKQLIRAHQKNEVGFKTLQAKAKIDITQNQKTQGATFNLRVKKDEVIWLSAPLGLARMMITPQKVQFYNKTDNTFFDGDYQLLSDFVGFDLDFAKVQNILMGQAIYDLKAQPHKVDIQEDSYVLYPKQQQSVLELFYLLNASHYKLNKLELSQSLNRRFLQVDYRSYQDVEKNVIPKEIKIVAVEDTDEALIDMEIKSVQIDGNVRFPFRIPSGYKEIELK